MDQDRYEQLEKYLRGQLSDKEKDHLEKEMELDKQLEKDLESVKSAIDAVEEFNIKSDLESIHRELYPEQEGNSKLSLTFISGIAAAVLLMITFWFVFRSEPPGPDKLFESYFSPFPDYVTIRNPGEPASWEKGFDAYTSGDFERAIVHFTGDSIPADKKEDIQFYLGVSYLASEKTKQAIVTFSDLLQQSIRYREQLHWYLSLAYLKENRIDEAREMLNRIEPGEYEVEKAGELLELLSNQKKRENGSTSTETAS